MCVNLHTSSNVFLNVFQRLPTSSNVFQRLPRSRPPPSSAVEHRRADFPQCGCCCARFLLEGTQAPQQAPVVAQWAPVAAPAAGALLGFVRELEALAELRRQGLLCEAEFEFAKRRLLQEQ